MALPRITQKEMTEREQRELKTLLDRARIAHGRVLTNSETNSIKKEYIDKLMVEPLSAKYKNIAGVEEKLTYTDTYAQENVTIDMEKVDFKALQGISGINVSAEDAKKGITMAQMELVMKAAGFKEVK